jgi:hypothetical protein
MNFSFEHHKSDIHKQAWCITKIEIFLQNHNKFILLSRLPIYITAGEEQGGQQWSVMHKIQPHMSQPGDSTAILQI